MKKVVLFPFLHLFVLSYGLGCGEGPDNVPVLQKPTNLLLRVVDELNNTFGCYFHRTVLTPNIDKLAGAGIKSTSMVEFVDIYPILADVFQLENTPSCLGGMSFKSVLQNPLRPVREFVYGMI